MTISTTTSRVDVNGNGVATVFSFAPVVIFSADDLQVTLRSATGVETVVLRGAGAANFSCGVTTFPGTGSITYPASGGTPLPAGAKLVIKRVLPFLQTVALNNQGAYMPAVQEGAFDYAMALTQQQQEQIGRTMQLASTDPSTPLTLPNSVARANQLLGFDSAGTPVAAQPSSAIVSTAMQSVVSAATTAAALALLEGAPTVSVKAFGAVGDGVTNDTAAVQAAITYALALPNGGDISFPSGTYIISAQVTIPKTAGKRVRLLGSVGSVVKNTAALTAHIFYVGSGVTAAGGSGVTFDGMNFVGANTTSSRCVKLENGNATDFIGCSFTSVYFAVEMVSSYSVLFDRCTFITNSVYSIYSSTSAHHMVVKDCKFFNTGTSPTYTIRIEVASDNIVLRDNDAETGWCFFSMLGGTALTFEGNYVEYFSNTPFYFDAAIKGASIGQNWVALSGNLTLGNITGGSYVNNSHYNQTVSVNAATLSDLAWSGNSLSGTGAISYSKVALFGATYPNAANDAGAAALGVPVNGFYRNGSNVMIRVV